VMQYVAMYGTKQWARIAQVHLLIPLLSDAWLSHDFAEAYRCCLGGRASSAGSGGTTTSTLTSSRHAPGMHAFQPREALVLSRRDEA
jgi:hypothetical protein